MRIFLATLALCASCARPDPAPQRSTDPDAQPCATAADCNGILPHLCRACADGGSECARWACLSGSCAVTLCGEAQQ